MKIALAAVSAVLLLALYWEHSWFGGVTLRRSSPRQLRRAHPPPQPAVRSVAVLPFRELSPGPAEESWGIGMTDAIITRLASLQNLAVRPTSSVLKYAKEPADPAKAAQELGVDSVLDGTYQKVSGVMRVSVQLVDRQNGAMRWAEHYDLRADDMLRFQDEVAQKVVEGMRVQVSGKEQESLGERSPLLRKPTTCTCRRDFTRTNTSCTRVRRV